MNKYLFTKDLRSLRSFWPEGFVSNISWVRFSNNKRKCQGKTCLLNVKHSPAAGWQQGGKTSIQPIAGKRFRESLSWVWVGICVCVEMMCIRGVSCHTKFHTTLCMETIAQKLDCNASLGVSWELCSPWSNAVWRGTNIPQLNRGRMPWSRPPVVSGTRDTMWGFEIAVFYNGFCWLVWKPYR